MVRGGPRNEAISLPSGPVLAQQGKLLIKNNIDELILIEAGTKLGYARPPDSEEAVLMDSYTALTEQEQEGLCGVRGSSNDEQVLLVC